MAVGHDLRIGRLREPARACRSSSPPSSSAGSGSVVGFARLRSFPGVLLSLRWAVVAQAAALERGSLDRRPAAQRRADAEELLARLRTVPPGRRADRRAWSSYGSSGPSITRRRPSAPSSPGPPLQIVVRSFEALATGLLYFDLDARAVGRESRPRQRRPDAASPTGRAADRPPARPEQLVRRGPARQAGTSIRTRPGSMRYWAADGTPTLEQALDEDAEEIAGRMERRYRRKAERSGAKDASGATAELGASPCGACAAASAWPCGASRSAACRGPCA